MSTSKIAPYTMKRVHNDRFMNFVLFTHDKKYSANKYTLLEIIMENPGLRFKKNLTTNRKRILMFIDMSYVYDL